MLRSFYHIMVIAFLAFSCGRQVEEEVSVEQSTKEKFVELQYDVVEGRHLFESNRLKWEVWQTPYRFPMHIHFYVEKGFEYPMVEKEDGPVSAEMMQVRIIGESEQGGQFLDSYITKSAYLRDGVLHLNEFNLFPKDFRKLKAGSHSLKFSIEGDFVTLDGTPSGTIPLLATIEMEVTVPEIHLTQVHFEELKLNMDQAMEILGQNDFSNGLPETGVKIFLSEEELFYAFTRNEDYLIQPTDIDVYHFNEDDKLEFEILDVDYGFNRDDLIALITIPLKELESDSPLFYEARGVKKLRVRARAKGVVN